MRRLHHGLILVLLSCATPGTAADWYVAPTGNDGAAGSQGAPWATIGKALAVSANNDRIHLQRGGTWRGTFTIGGGRQLLAFGSGADPVITASVVVPMTGTWASNASVRTGPTSAEAISLWVDGAFQPLARYPNSGFLQTASGTTLSSITCAGLPGRPAGRWTGAQVRWHRWHWFWETRRITADPGGSVLTLDGQAVAADGTATGLAETGLVGITSGFYIDKDLDELDTAGEWFSSASTVYVYPPAGVDGSAMTVEIATDASAITVNGATIRGISFRRFGCNALQVNAASTIEDCSFAEIGDTAISTSYNSAPVAIQRCVFSDIRNCGVVVTQNPASTGTLVQRNLFQRIGMERGYGGSGTWHHVGVLSNVGAISISLNRIVDCGYAGILLGNTPGNTANRNVIVRSLSTSNDGAGIYTYKGPNTMSENIVLDTRGDQTAAEPFFPFGNGIWPEFLDGIADSQITDNTIAGCNGNGIALINNFTCTISRNVLFDNLTSGIDLDVTNDNTTGQGHTIDDNVFATLATTRRLPVVGNLASWYAPRPSAGLAFYNSNPVDFGLMRRSVFVTGSGTHMARGAGGGDPVYATIPALSTAKPSWFENSGTTSNQNAVLLINDTEQSAAVPVPAGTWTRTDGSAASGTVTLAAFRSLVLVGSGAAPATPIYRAASGIDWRQSEPTQVPLYATPELAVSRNGTRIGNGANDAITGTVNGTGTALSYQIDNRSLVQLNLTSTVTLAPTGCTISGLSQPSTPVMTSPSTLAFTVTPTAAAAWSVVVTIASDDPGDNPFVWTASGTATAAPQPEIAFRTVPDDQVLADGGTFVVGASTATTATAVSFDVINLGSADLVLGTPQIDTRIGCQARITTLPATTIPAGQRSRLHATVTPSAIGAWSCHLTCTSNDPDANPAGWTISGVAVAKPSGSGLSNSGGGGGGGGGCGAGGAAAMLCGAAMIFGLRRRR